MKIEISKIKIAGRIRKEIGKIEELAVNIREHGLISPVTVMPLDGGEYQLLAGLRRLRAMELNGEAEIDVKVFPPSDAEAALKIEYSENEHREPFTLAEKMEYAAIIQEIERAKGLKRMSDGGKGGADKGCAQARNLKRNRTDAVVGEKVGMKETSYRYARYIAEHAPEMIARIDSGEIQLRAAYNEVRAKEKSEKTSEPNISQQTETAESTPLRSPARRKKDTPLPEKYKAMDSEAIRKRKEFDALSPEDKIAELQNQLREACARAAGAEMKLSRETELRKNDIFHYNSTIKMLNERLKSAYMKISELEKKYEPDNQSSWEMPESICILKNKV